MTQAVEQLRLRGAAGDIAVLVQGPVQGAAVLMTHSILSSSMMWDLQAQLLADRGYRVIRADTRGHGQSQASPAPCGHRAVFDAAVGHVHEARVFTRADLNAAAPGRSDPSGMRDSSSSNSFKPRSSVVMKRVSSSFSVSSISACARESSG